MLKNYIITAINNLLKNKMYSAINIVGLAIGLAACIVIALYVKDQYSYDNQWKNSDRIYRVNYFPRAKHLPKSARMPLPALPQLEEFFNDKIERGTRTFANNSIISIGTSRFEDRLVRVDPAFIEMFPIEVLAGSLKTTLTNPTNIALSAETAGRFFGDRDPIGKVITVRTFDISTDYKVTAVYRIPGSTVLDIPILSLLDITRIPPALNSWYDLNTGTYLQLKDGIDIEVLRPLTPAFLDKYLDVSQFFPDPDFSGSDIGSIDFQSIVTLHLDSPWDASRAGGNKTVVLSFAAISLLVLLIGCINFTILTIAKATQRAREVALRKVVGAKRRQIIVQFLGESAFIVLLAMILSMGLVEIMLPIFESIVGKTLSLDYTPPATYLPLLVMFLIVGISGGLYPAFILSGFKPGNILRANQTKETSGSLSLRNILVIFQFSISIILIIATGVIYTQMQYSLSRDPGYNKDNLLVINRIYLHPELDDRIETLKQELLYLPNVTNTGLSDIQPSQQRENYLMFTHPGQTGTSYTMAYTCVGYDYFTTYQIPLIAGRDYSVERDIPEPETDIETLTVGGNESGELIERNIIINESAARKLGFVTAKEAVGKNINSTTIGNFNYTIIGVVADNNIFSINAAPRAEVYLLITPDLASVITVRFKGFPKMILEDVKSVWKKVMGEVDMSHIFLDQLLVEEFEREQTEETILISFSLLAILIACMGLFGMASFTLERRTKEIGLRKVMGAKVKIIVSLLLWQFSKPVLIANIIAWPVALFAMQSWLESFPYRFNPLFMIPICLISGLIALAIAWFTVTSNTIRVAKSNPIHALRYE